MIDNKYGCNVNVLMHTDSSAIRTATGGRIHAILFISTPITAALYTQPVTAGAYSDRCIVQDSDQNLLYYLTRNLLAPTTVGARINPWVTNVIYIYGAPILDVSRSHTTTHHSR